MASFARGEFCVVPFEYVQVLCEEILHVLQLLCMWQFLRMCKFSMSPFFFRYLRCQCLCVQHLWYTYGNRVLRQYHTDSNPRSSGKVSLNLLCFNPYFLLPDSGTSIYLQLFGLSVDPKSSASMLVCDICTQEVSTEDDMKSHLMVAHMEQDRCCPFCAVTGLAYDDLSYHIHTDHADTMEPWSSDEEQSEILKEKKCSTSSANSSSGQELSKGIHRITPEECRVPPDAEKKNNKRQSSGKEEDNPKNIASNCTMPMSEEPSPGSAIFVEGNAPPTASATHIAGEVAVECPFCCKSKNSLDKLELHVRTEHADLLASPPKGSANQEYECPMCSLVCANSTILQEHVNLHLEENYDTGMWFFQLYYEDCQVSSPFTLSS
ncbi:unnamed protein product [Ranitomeya imitator]|uniref:C2H2-type domain-containing protein n=1 Tax=Ranitomeya imitator TaxID=111125 RepID=A0ABN9LMI5_9NEOB|nr:unnamed protein product [Ranitomeya imitator]